MIIGRCNQCDRPVYDTDEHGRAIIVYFCDIHYEYRTLRFCSEEHLDNHIADCHQSIDLV